MPLITKFSGAAGIIVKTLSSDDIAVFYPCLPLVAVAAAKTSRMSAYCIATARSYHFRGTNYDYRFLPLISDDSHH